MPADFDKRLCCAAGICCQDGSPEQLDALASLYREKLPEHTGAALAPGLEVLFARITLALFKLESREPLPPEILPKEPKERGRKQGATAA